MADQSATTLIALTPFVTLWLAFVAAETGRAVAAIRKRA